MPKGRLSLLGKVVGCGARESRLNVSVAGLSSRFCPSSIARMHYVCVDMCDQAYGSESRTFISDCPGDHALAG